LWPTKKKSETQKTWANEKNREGDPPHTRFIFIKKGNGKKGIEEKVRKK